MIKISIPLALCMVVGLPAHAQDIPSPYESAIADHGMIQLQSTLGRRRIEQAQQRSRKPLSAADVQQVNAACRNKHRTAARFSAAGARRFYRACATLGY